MFHLGRMVKPYHTHLVIYGSVIWYCCAKFLLFQLSQLLCLLLPLRHAASLKEPCIFCQLVELALVPDVGEPMKSPRSGILSRRILCVKMWFPQQITKNEDLRNQHGGLTNTFWKPKIGVMVHRNEAKKQTWTMTNARWMTSSLIMIPQMMGIGKLTGLNYRRTHQNQLRRSKALLFGHPSGPGAQRHLGRRSRDGGAQRLSVGLAPFPVIIADEVLSPDPGI